MTSAIINDDARRSRIQQHPTLNGIDYLEVDTAPEADNQRVMRVYLLPPDPHTDPALIAKVSALLDTLALPANGSQMRISGGVRTRHIRIIDAQRSGDHLRLRVDQPGDFSDYVLTIDNSALDPFFKQITFNFKAGCPSRFDCKPAQDCPPEIETIPPIDYMAKDYQSFRQALIDFLPTIIPGWTEHREADLGMTMLELFAYMGDQLSYFQDAVANEAYLETARQRISVRRHARLIDYAMHDGLSAMTFIHLEVSAIKRLPILTLPNGLPPPGGAAYADDPGIVALALSSADAVFEVLLDPDETVQLDPILNQIAIYAWENDEVYLPRGATSADLAGAPGAPGGLPLKQGDYLLFEERISPYSGLEADRDPDHRQIVRLTKVIPNQLDPLTSQVYTTVEWSAEDALTFPVCVATRSEDAVQLRNVSVARGNLLLAYHGRTFTDQHAIFDPEALVETGLVESPPSLRGYRFTLQHAPLSFLPGTEIGALPVARLQTLAPRGAKPAVTALTESIGGQQFAWNAVTPDLLASSRFATDFVVETDNDHRAVLRFGDNQFGMIPSGGAELTIEYRVGVGRGGNVGADVLVCFIDNPAVPDLKNVRAVRNPIPAWGGADPESMAAVKQTAPAAFHAETYRAVTEQDYVNAAMQHPAVRSAVATFRWTGSWHTVFITIDPHDTAEISADLRADVLAWVSRFALAGYDLEIATPIFVPLVIELDVCAAAGYFPSDVEQALYRALSRQRFVDGTLGFFHPDNFTFDQPIYLSRLYAAVERVAGVESVAVLRFAQRYEADPDPARPATRRNLNRGYIDAGRLEIIRLDNDPNFPENGLLSITVRGGS